MLDIAVDIVGFWLKSASLQTNKSRRPMLAQRSVQAVQKRPPGANASTQKGSTNKKQKKAKYKTHRETQKSIFNIAFDNLLSH